MASILLSIQDTGENIAIRKRLKSVYDNGGVFEDFEDIRNGPDVVRFPEHQLRAFRDPEDPTALQYAISVHDKDYCSDHE
eukprot:COSAG03_NODE_7004_length_977_cov_1.072893_2_plen_80_part_00